MEVTESPVEVSPTVKLPEIPKKDPPGIVPSHGISIDVEPPPSQGRPSLVKHVSTPTYDSPIRHHRRTASAHREVKESLNARSEYITSQDDGAAQHRINQYIIKQEIGRGSFGAVHLAVDQYGQEYAVKEFSKSRLRKRAQSHILRQPRGQRRMEHLAAGGDFNSPLHRHPEEYSKMKTLSGHAIDLIKEEIAIMKKLNHNNLVSLIEVLDDPTEDSLYMVMEMCKKGVVMKVGLDDRADPYENESCRCWFRDLILGIEFLHAQGVVHRDIKPDNCLLTEDDVLKVVDFGVSEMFEKHSEMVTAKSAGSPAFLPPELCVVKHGDVSAKASDIWSMGVTLYCLKYGRIPFEKAGIFELYESIKADPLDLDGESDADFRDLMTRILDKNPKTRIAMAELREHPWVTKRGADPLLSFEENTADLVEPPTDAEMDAAITGNMNNLFTVMKAVRKFKALIAHKRPPVMSSILGENDASRMSLPPLSISVQKPRHPSLKHKPRSLEVYDRKPIEGALTAEGVHRTIDPGEEVQPSLQSLILAEKDNNDSPLPEAGFLRREATASPDIEDALLPFLPDRPHDQAQLLLHGHTVDVLGHRGHAHDPLEDHLYLRIGPSTFAGDTGEVDRRASFMPDEDDILVVSESPGAADVDIYETAYRDEIERIKARLRQEGKEEEPQVYLTRRVDAKLLALGGLAGRLRSMGEGGLEKVGDIRAIKEGRVKVSGMSRALRSAAREEYERHRAERIARHQQAAEASGEEEKARPSDIHTENVQPNNGQNKRVLRNAVKEEYERHRAERKTKHQPGGGASITGLEGEATHSPQTQEDEAQEPQRKRPSLTFMTTNPLAEKAWEKSRQAKSSFKDMLGRMKDRGGSGGSGSGT